MLETRLFTYLISKFNFYRQSGHRISYLSILTKSLTQVRQNLCSHPNWTGCIMKAKQMAQWASWSSITFLSFSILGVNGKSGITILGIYTGSCITWELINLISLNNYLFFIIVLLFYSGYLGYFFGLNIYSSESNISYNV